MAEARRKDAWDRTSTVLALIANVNRDPKKTRAFRPKDFNPYERHGKAGMPITKGNIEALKVFVKRDRKKEMEHGRSADAEA